MLTHVKQYLKLKREAMRLMITGDVANYMHKLREMHDLRAKLTGLSA